MVGDMDGLDVVGDADLGGADNTGGDVVDVGIDVGDGVGPGVMGESVVTLLAIGLSAGEHGLPFSEMRTVA